MTGGSENAAGEKDGGPTLTTQVPVGWQRKVEDGFVAYISPSYTVLCSVEEVRVYLLTDSTCKCGLECPLVLHKVFNFDPAAVVQAPSHQSGKVEEDMTKLCNHRRKVVAMAALCRSMQTSQIPLTAHGAGGVVRSVDGRELRGSIVTRGDMGHCTYLTQPRLNQPRPSSSSSIPAPSPVSLLQNGSVSQPTSVLASDQSSPLKWPPAQSPGPYGKQQWNPHPAITQAILQRAPHKPPSPSTTKIGTHTHAYQQDLPISFSSPPSSSSPVMSRAGQSHLQGTIVKSPSPLSVSSSPSHARDSFSPHQRSRHSSTSSLSEGAPGSVLSHAHGVKPPQSPLHSSQPPVSSPKLLLPLANSCIRPEGVLQQYKECNTNTNINSTQHHNALSNQSNLHAPQNPQLAHSSHCDRRNGSGASAPSPGLLGLPLGQILCQQKSQQQHISSSFPASSLLSAAAKAQLASQKNQSQSGAAEATAALPLLDKDQQSKGSLSSPALVSTSVSCTPLLPVSGQEVCDSLTEQEKTSTQTPPFLPPLLPPGVLGDLTALGNINSLHSLLGAGHLLLPQAPSLGMTLPQNQGGLNPLTCLQLSMAPALMGEKPLALHEAPPTQEDLPPSQLAQDSLLNPGHVQTPSQQREVSVGTPESGLLDPYGSFMDTIYTSFLQVSGRGSDEGSDSTPLSYPELPPLLQQPSGPPSLSPRRAYSVHNPDLSRLSMEAAQSPARGTPKLTEDSSTPPPSKPARADACPADAPLHLAFMEEAKTDGSSKLCVYSNGIGSGVRAGEDDDIDDDDEEDEERQPQGYLSPRERGISDTMDETMGNADTDQGRATEIRTGARRGRKRKQTLQRGQEVPVEIDSTIQEPVATIALQRPARAARGKRRRVVR